MKIALIITDFEEQRNSRLVALELDEKISQQGYLSHIFDLSESSCDLDILNQFDAYLLIGNHSGPMYNAGTHHLLANHRHQWRDQRIGSVFVTNEPLLAASADLDLKRTLKVLGANLLPDQMIVIDAESIFDHQLILQDNELSYSFDQYLSEFVLDQWDVNLSDQQLA